MAASNTVTVVCRLPSGVRLDLYDMERLKENAEAAKTGAHAAAPVPVETVLLAGVKADPVFKTRPYSLGGLGGRTEVSADFWNAWLAQNEGSALVKRGLVFAEATPARADAKLTELSGERTGLEGNDPSKPIEGADSLDKTAQ